MTQPSPTRPAVSRQLRDQLRDNALRSPLADQVADLAARRQLHPPVVVTATGPVYLIDGRVRWAAPDVALRRIQELHRRATGHTGPFRTALPSTLTPGQAFRAYSNALVALLAQLAVLPTAERAHLATSLAAYATRTGSLDGLEAVFLSAARAAQRANDKATLATMATSFARVGLPRILGGGALTAPLLDVRSGQLVLVSAGRLRQAGLAGDLAAFSSSVSSLFAAPRPDAGRAAGGSPFADGVADYIQIGAAIGAAVGAVAGAVLGAGTPVSVPAALAGAATGAQLGATVGGIVGLIIGTEVSVEATPPAPPSEPHDGGLPGGVGGGDGDGSPGGSGGGSGGGEGGNSGGGGSGGSGGGGSGGGDEGGQPPAPDPGGSGEGGIPNPDDPGGDDGGESVSTRVPAGSGLGALTSYAGGNSFTITGLPRLGDAGGNGGFLSGVPGFGSTDPVDNASPAEPVGGSLRVHGPVSIPSGRVVDPLPDAFTGVIEQPGPGGAGR